MSIVQYLQRKTQIFGKAKLLLVALLNIAKECQNNEHLIVSAKSQAEIA